MKKLFISIMALAAITFSSCGGNSTSGDIEAADSIAEEIVDSIAATPEVSEIISSLQADVESGDVNNLEATIRTIQQYIAQFMNEGNKEKADEYTLKLKEFINDNKDKINELTTGTTLSTVISSISNSKSASELVKGITDAIPVNKETIDAAKAAVTEKADEAAQQAIDETKTKAEEAIKNAADETKAKAEAAAKQAADEAKAKAEAAAKQAADDAKKKLGF